MNKETLRLKEIELKLRDVKRSYEDIFPIWNQLDRKVKWLGTQIRQLEDEKFHVDHGQLNFDLDF